MIKAVAKNKDGSTTLLLGLSEGNVSLLREHKPILIDLKKLDAEEGLGCRLSEAKIVIILGKTEESLISDLKKVFGPNVEIRDEYPIN